MQINQSQGAVQPFMSFLTHNQTIQAVATICTLLGGLVLLVAALRFVWRRARDVYLTSFKAALKKWRGFIRLTIVLAAADIHIFMAAVVYFGCVAALGLMVPLILSALSLTYAKPVAAAMAGALVLFAVYGVGFTLVLIWLAITVLRRRVRKRTRIWRGRMIEARSRH